MTLDEGRPSHGSPLKQPLRSLRPRHIRRLLLLLTGVAVVGALGYWFLDSRATRLLNTMFRDFATSETARLSDSVYALGLGSLTVTPPTFCGNGIRENGEIKETAR